MVNKLDEMQEQKLLHIERNGCWFAFWALIAVMFIQMAIFGIDNFRNIAGEWIVFMVLALYLCIACVKNGIWSKRTEPNVKANLFISLVSAVVFGAIFAIVNYFNFKSVGGALATFVIMAVILFVGIYLALMISAMIYKKRVRDLENKYEE